MSQQPLFVGCEQRVRPGDRGAQVMVAGRRVGLWLPEQVEGCRIETREDFRNRQRRRPHRRELDREREPFEPSTQPGDGPAVARAEAERPGRRGRAPQ